MNLRAEIKPASVTESGLKVGTCEQLTSERARLKREVFSHLRSWLTTGNPYSRRLALSKSDALCKPTSAATALSLDRGQQNVERISA